MKDLHLKLEAFKVAAHDLCVAWTDCNDDLSERYPFATDFDDLNRQIDTWVNFHVPHLSLWDCDQKLFGTGLTLDEADNLAHVIIQSKKHSDLFYSITVNGQTTKGSIDLEPKSFHAPYTNIVTNHLRTFWTNISKIEPSKDGKPRYGFTPVDIEYFTNLLNIL